MLTVVAALWDFGCIRGPDPLEPESAALGIISVVVPGLSDAHLLASHPHRSQSGSAPVVDLRLIGPDWEATFSDEVPPDDCGMTDLAEWPGTLVCLRAELPEPIRERTLYMLSGTGPAGPINGAVTVPSTPMVLDPADGQQLPPQSTGDDLPVPIRFETASDVAWLHSEVVDAVEIQDDGTELPIGPVSLQPLVLDLEAGTADLILTRASPSLYKRIYLGRPVWLSLRVLGLGQNYANFIEVAGGYPVRHPWPSFGLEGAYGYFAGAAPSKAVRVLIAPLDPSPPAAAPGSS